MFKTNLNISVCLSMLASVFFTGCYPVQSFERTIELSKPLESGSILTAKTHNGHIHVNGIETDTCKITAKITGRAKTLEKAQELSEAVDVRLEEDGSKDLDIIIKKPKTSGNESTAVTLDITLPEQTSHKLTTHNGSIKLNSITGLVKSVTHNGKIIVANLSGDSSLKTHNGNINCKQVSGSSDLHTHNGSVSLEYTNSNQNPERIKITTHNGSISFKAPDQYSAAVSARTHNGSVHTDLPITITGRIDKRNINGKIGTGQGKLRLETHNGSIYIK